MVLQAKKTMIVAQQLYEGIDIKGIGTTGLITYIRTDSTRISDEALEADKELYRKKNMERNIYLMKRGYIRASQKPRMPMSV